MSHALRSINPEAAERLNQGVETGPVAPAPAAPEEAVPGWGQGGDIELDADNDSEGLVGSLGAVDARPEFANDYIEIPLEPEAEKPDLGPMPTIGSMVVVQLRPGDHRRHGRRRFPAMVMGVDIEARTVDATIIIEHNDVWSQERIPPCVGDEMGWLFSDDQIAAQRVAERLEVLIRLVFGHNFIADDDPSIYDRMSDLYDRLAKLEGRPLNAPVPVAAKSGKAHAEAVGAAVGAAVAAPDVAVAPRAPRRKKSSAPAPAPKRRGRRRSS